MSRYDVLIGPKEDYGVIVYGFDHSLGYFIDVYEWNSGDPNVPVLSECSAFGMSRSLMLSVFDDYSIGYKIPEEHKAAIAMDLPF